MANIADPRLIAALNSAFGLGGPGNSSAGDMGDLGEGASGGGPPPFSPDLVGGAALAPSYGGDAGSSAGAPPDLRGLRSNAYRYLVGTQGYTPGEAMRMADQMAKQVAAGASQSGQGPVTAAGGGDTGTLSLRLAPSAPPMLPEGVSAPIFGPGIGVNLANAPLLTDDGADPSTALAQNSNNGQAQKAAGLAPRCLSNPLQHSWLSAWAGDDHGA